MKPLKRPKYPETSKNDLNAPKAFKISKIAKNTLKPLK